MMSEQELKEIEARCGQAQAGPWKAYIEGRDHESGSNVIITGEDVGLEILEATDADLDFIANAKQDIPRLIEEVRRLKKILDSSKQK